MATTDRNDCAVAFCCDRNYFHLALFTIRQLAFYNPHRSFDFIVATQDDLVVPDWARSLGMEIHQIGKVPETGGVGRFHGSLAPFFRIMLARELQHRYRRILYLDCDLFIEGGDVNRLLQIDMGPHPIAAVLDAPFMYESNYRAREFQKLGWPAAPYANTGLQLIDTKAYVEQELERRSFELCMTHAEAIVYTDQSLTNILLRGRFAQLAPCWNWQCNHRLPLVTARYPVFIRHFIGRKKPDQESSGVLEARFNHAYREFLTQYMPDLLPKLAKPADPAPMPFPEAMLIVLRHYLARNIVAEVLKRHPDPYTAII